MRFAFDVMASGKEFCNRQDVIGLVSLLHSEKTRVIDTTNTLMGIMDPHNRDKVSFDTFRCARIVSSACRRTLAAATTCSGVICLMSPSHAVSFVRLGFWVIVIVGRLYHEKEQEQERGGVPI